MPDNNSVVTLTLMSSKRFGAIEAGGTKFVCCVGTGPESPLETVTIPTTTPEATLGAVTDFFHAQEASHGKITGLGIASFGPIDCRPDSPTFGFITSTPKSGWPQTDFVGTLKQAFPVPIGFNTDVNAAALAESRWGAAKNLGSCLYITVGTGIGGGFVFQGKMLTGLMHPEMGHVRVVKHPYDDFKGTCPYHGSACLEGMASGPAIRERWGQPADTLKPSHQAWEFQTHYLSQAIVDWLLVLSPECVVLGGGVMQQKHLFPWIRREVARVLNGYLQVPAILDRSESLICEPGLGTQSGILGALALAIEADEAVSTM
jgi:fructokinase